MEHQYLPFNGNYEKEFYDVRLHNGQEIHDCWPNAGMFHAPGGTVITGAEVSSVRLSQSNLSSEDEDDGSSNGLREGVKYDDGKPSWALLPWRSVEEIVRVLDFGARKYAARNWEQGISYSRVFSALQRHLTAWWEGEDRDPETGLSHLAHAGCCLVFLLTYVRRGMREFDDRPGSGTSSLQGGESYGTG